MPEPIFTTKIAAVPPSETLIRKPCAGGVCTARARHRRDGDCEAMYVVDAQAAAAGFWTLAPGWQARIATGTGLKQAKGVWESQVSWLRPPSSPTVFGIVICIVPEGEAIFPMLAEVDLGQNATAAALTGPILSRTAALPIGVPQGHLDAIEAAFASKQTAAAFNSARLG